LLDGEENVMPAAQNNNAVESMQSHTLIPFIIGVTGHRDPVHLQGESTTKVEIKQAIKDWQVHEQTQTSRFISYSVAMSPMFIQFKWQDGTYSKVMIVHN